jgi:hypothetical protein
MVDNEEIKSGEVKLADLNSKVTLENSEKIVKGRLEKIKKMLLPEDQAREEWKKYCEVLKTRKEKYLRVMKDAMYQMKEGNPIIDVYEAIRKAGLNKNNEPRFAISRADLSTVYFRKRDEGTGKFGWEKYSSTDIVDSRDNINLPANLFKIHWDRAKNRDGTDATWEIEKQLLKTKVPIIPVEILPDGDLENYYILWEVKEWESLPETKDPFLLKRISENLFAVLGQWDVTELERAVISGLK